MPSGEAKQARIRDRWLCPLDSRLYASSRNRACALLPLSVDVYLEMLDWTGRQIRTGKRGSIPAHLAPILKRLSLEVDGWVRMV